VTVRGDLEYLEHGVALGDRLELVDAAAVGHRDVGPGARPPRRTVAGPGPAARPGRRRARSRGRDHAGAPPARRRHGRSAPSCTRPASRPGTSGHPRRSCRPAGRSSGRSASRAPPAGPNDRARDPPRTPSPTDGRNAGPRLARPSRYIARARSSPINVPRSPRRTRLPKPAPTAPIPIGARRHPPQRGVDVREPAPPTRTGHPDGCSDEWSGLGGTPAAGPAVDVAKPGDLSSPGRSAMIRRIEGAVSRKPGTSPPVRGRFVPAVRDHRGPIEKTWPTPSAPQPSSQPGFSESP
jgi:hypothetical protein